MTPYTLQCTPICSALYARSMAILTHFAETYPKSKEKKELGAAYLGPVLRDANGKPTRSRKAPTNGSAMGRYSRTLLYFYYLYYALIVLLWLSSGLGAVCMSKAQPARH